MNEPSIYLLSIGINQYNFIRPLNCASQDAQDIAELLKQNGSISVTAKILLNAQANKAAIMEKLTWLAGKAGVNDTAILFFTGHGLQQMFNGRTDTYLCPVEASLAKVEQTCIHSDELTVALRAIQAKRLVVLLDTCHAGALGEVRNLSQHIQPGVSAHKLASMIEGSGRVIFSACRPDENAWEINGLRNGLFTHYLLQGLQGGAAREDGSVWTSDLFSYVSRLVRQQQLQIPYQKAIGEDFVILPGVPASPQVMTQAQPLTPHIDPKLLRKSIYNAYNRSEFALLCTDLGLNLENITGDHLPLEIQILHLIDYCNRHGTYRQLVDHILSERPHLNMP